MPEFRAACNSSGSGQQKLAELARLMNDSQTSCRWPPDPAVVQHSCEPHTLLVSKGRSTGHSQGICERLPRLPTTLNLARQC